MFTYDTGTNTPRTTWPSSDETGPAHTNPVVSDSNGIFPEIYGTGQYKIQIFNQDDTVLLFESDPISGNLNETELLNIEKFYATVDAAKSDSSAPLGARVQTKEYSTGSVAGGAVYDVVTLAQFQTIRTPATTPDGFKDHLRTDGNVLLLDLSNGINVYTYGIPVNDPSFDSLSRLNAVFTDLGQGGIKIESVYGKSFEAFYISGTLVIPDQCAFTGSSRQTTRIIGMPSFTDPHLVRLGTVTLIETQGCRVENMLLDVGDGNNSTIALYSNSINEDSGTRQVQTTSRRNNAILIDNADTGSGAGSPKNFEIIETEAFVSDSQGTETIVGINTTGGPRLISALTMVGGGFAGGSGIPAAVGLLMRGGTKGAPIIGVHGEGCNNIIQLGTALEAADGITIHGVTGPAAASLGVINVINIPDNSNVQNIFISGINKRTATNSIRNEITGIDHTITDTGVSFYSMGNGAVADREVESSSVNVENIIGRQVFGKLTRKSAVQKNANFTVNANDAGYVVSLTSVNMNLPTVTADLAGGEWNHIHVGSGVTTIQPVTGTLNDPTGAVVASFPTVLGVRYTVTANPLGTDQWFITN
jgi:hypothetical protein